MRNIDQSRYTKEQVFERQKPHERVKHFLSIFHEMLLTHLEQKQMYFYIHYNINGLAYYCNQRKVFIWVNICQNFLSIKLFTGKSEIAGVTKSTWLNANDNQGSIPFRISDEATLNKAIQYALESYRIAKEW